MMSSYVVRIDSDVLMGGVRTSLIANPHVMPTLYPRNRHNSVI